MKEQEFNLKLPQSAVKDYISVDFELDPDTERLEVSYEYDEGSLIDLAVYFNDKKWGWSGGERDSFFITRYCATPGYSAGLPQGKWSVIIGTYEINADFCNVKVKVRQHKKHYRWLKGDMHSHTEHSDGAFELTESIQLCKELGLDFLCTSDHNTTVQNHLKPSSKDEFVLIPGLELTSYRGHCNYLGVKEPISDFRILDRSDIDRCMEEAVAQNAVIGINHPFVHCPWLWGFDVPYTYVEIWNGPWGRRNQLALEWWHEELCKGHRVNMAGGSDVHKCNPRTRHGHATSHVYVDEQTPDAILDAVRSGRVFITANPDAPRLSLNHNEQMVMGSDIAEDESIDLSIEQLQPNDLIKIIDDTGVIHTTEATKESTYKKQIKLKNQFIRLEVWRYQTATKQMEPVAISNPVYRK